MHDDDAPAAGVSPGSLLPGRMGRYVVRRRIGAGGFATVWLAYDEQLDAPVAIKVLADNWTADHHVRTRFVEEGRFLRRVESPHVVTVYDAGDLDDGRPYLVMTYADQGTLADRLADVERGAGAPVTVPQALSMVRQVADGLQALHDRDVLHRDVKPANVLFRTVRGARGAEPELRALVGDLGLGKALDVSSRLTMIAGTPSYVSPEQAQGETPDARSDQYSLAAIAFLVLTGRPAFTHASLTAAADPGPPPALPAPGQPAAAQAVVHRGLAREREERFATVTDFADALAEAFEGWEPPADAATAVWRPRDPGATQAGAVPTPRSGAAASEVATPPVAAPRRRRRLALAALGLAVLAGGAAGGWALQRAVAPDEVTIGDAGGTLAVTVPVGWRHQVATQGWTPTEEGTYPAVATGSDAGWTRTGSSAEGVFAGLLPTTAAEDLPDPPQHPECETPGEPVRRAGSVTVVSEGCPGDVVVVERLDRVAENRVLWVQVRADDGATATRVLDSVRVSGI
ncbi:serine/threonine-protein kinase [Nocardioides nanhaiensis]|uniref:non-specific serine/threonine protein kinase n=1 Tax=Nocardioides nanhaiensis TaxID=1476871 RepID=A0ABP8VSD5_9ACTN